VPCKQGVTGSIPVTSTNFFLIAKELKKLLRPERSIIRAHRARMRHWSTSVHKGAVEKALSSSRRRHTDRPANAARPLVARGIMVVQVGNSTERAARCRRVF